MKLINTILSIIAVMFMVACNEPDCVSKTTNFVNVKFYKTDINEIDTLTITSLSAIGDDSVFVKNANATSVRLPLRHDQSFTTFVFSSEFGMDTLTLTYKVQARLISEDCGIETIFSELGYDRNDFDSISVVNKILIEDITEDVKIYN